MAAKRLTVNLEKLSHVANGSLYTFFVAFFFLGYYISFYFHFLTVAFFLMSLINIYLLYFQKDHTLLSNFGFLAQVRYLVESIGPEFRQYLYMSDTEEKPFNRTERAEVYLKSKNEDSSSAFGSLSLFNNEEIKLRHSMFPNSREDLKPFRLEFGHGPQAFSITKPFMISAMSYGALSHKAVRALARGAEKANIPMNTGEGGYPKYHFMENCDLIFQMGTAKFGVRTEDGLLDDEKLESLSKKDQIKMIEIKFSQGAKPGKGGILPKEKLTEEIAELRGVPMGKDVISPPFHKECTSPEKTVQFIQKVKEVSQLPVGIKLCLGHVKELSELFDIMKRQNVFCDYVAVDGAEGGTGAAPKHFMDNIGVPIYRALPVVQKMLLEKDMRYQVKLVASGKLINAGTQFTAFSMGADAIYSARGFMLALGCIQSLKCNSNTCPVGITSHKPRLYGGLDVENKSQRVANYVKNLWYDHQETLASMGKSSHQELGESNLYVPDYF